MSATDPRIKWNERPFGQTHVASLFRGATDCGIGLALNLNYLPDWMPVTCPICAAGEVVEAALSVDAHRDA